jgi:ribose transport system permease protein
MYRALALIYTGGTPIFGLPSEFWALTNGALIGIPNPVIVVALLAILAWIILNKTPLAEFFMAVGGNPEAARIAGVPVTLTKMAAYMISGLMAAVAAMILIGRLGAAEPTMGTLWELDAIAAAATGGASLMGGHGSIPGTLIGCIILGTLRNGLTLMNIQAFYQLLATGIIIIVSMLIDKVTSGKEG